MSETTYDKVIADTDLTFNKNEDSYRDVLYHLKKKLMEVKKGGGERSTAKHKK